MKFQVLCLIAGLTLTTGLAACSSSPDSTNQTSPAADSSQPADAMKKDGSGDAMMKKDGDAMMKKDGDAMMKKDGDAMMKKDGDAMMKKDGDAMKKEPTTTKP